MIQERPIKSEINLQDREMFEILLHTLYREHFFDERFPGNDLGSLGYMALVAVL